MLEPAELATSLPWLASRLAWSDSDAWSMSQGYLGGRYLSGYRTWYIYGMARFLSDAWFDEVSLGAERQAEAHGDGGNAGSRDRASAAGQTAQGGAPELVVEVIASGAPEGEVRYQLVMELDGPRLVWRKEDFRASHVELRAGYGTLAGIASGELSAIDALSAGLARVSGNIAALSVNQSGIGGLDLVPAAVRATTTFA